ncbi:MAG: BolA/IbaG family iron-sulfur metabolism protein [Alphaproteobacteria bacterium]
MPMPAAEIETLLKQAFPDASITLSDLRGDDDHFSVRVESHQFVGKSRIQQHQMVYQALKGGMDNRLHALSVTTAIPTS